MDMVLHFADYAIITCIVVLLGGSAARYFSNADQVRLRRVERSLEAIMRKLGIDDADTLVGISPAVKTLLERDQKLEAIKVHRGQTGLGLAEARDDIEGYLKSKGQ
ncbi:MAG TPA: hypothetical protein VHE55_10385 [Fimbriimonadaceae bacterium]|nr:hypothetical protein [Fimbriimonadaceae bacterium]